MFILSVLKDTIRLLPHTFGKDDFQSQLIDRINALANYVVPDVGLGITFHDFVEIGPSFILPGDACTYTPVKFRYVFFCPIVDEILEGVVSRSGTEGVSISMGFFQDIL
ncbi:RNA polymerase Rpb7N-terminal domain containing protein, partial [Aphelenchoides avenae]